MKRCSLVISLIAGALLIGCGSPPEKIGLKAAAKIGPIEGNSTTGQVTFSEVAGGVRIVAEIEGLTPGAHGFHIHVKGDCSAPDGTSAGGHFNPDGSPHGSPDNEASERHVGDLGNLMADATGTANYDRVDKVISLSGEKSIVGRGIIIHSGEDDLTSQPTGNAGKRLACGVIE